MTVTIVGLDAVMRQMNPAALQGAIGDVLMAVALHAQGIIAPYPGQNSRPQPFKTARQRRAFFAKLRAGEIEVPYRRGSSPGSETLGRRWHIQRTGAMRVELVNNASYAGLVQGAETQTAYHRASGWLTDDGVVQRIESSGIIQRIAEQRIAHLFGG